MVQTKEERKEYTRIWRENNIDKASSREYSRIWRENNIVKVKERERLYRENNKERQREWHKIYNQTPAGIKTRIMALWRKRGVINVNDEMYERYLNTTKCDVCCKIFSSSMDKHLDHDHETGEFRWILCRSCNTRDHWKKKINTHLVG